MTLQLLQPHMDTSLASKTANSVLDRVFLEIKSLIKTAEYSDGWIENSLNILRFSIDIENGFAHSRAMMLAIFRQVWQDLPGEFQKQYFYSFMEFAKYWTGGKAVSTINNRLAAAQVWLLEDYGKGKMVAIKERGLNGKPIRNDRGAEITKLVEFCPYSIDISKLEILTPRARNDDMTDELWEMLVDPFFSCDDIRAEHTKDKKDGNGHQYTMSYGLQGPMLVVYQNGAAVEIAEFNWAEYEQSPLVKDAIHQILKILNVQMDEDRIHELVKEAYR